MAADPAAVVARSMSERELQTQVLRIARVLGYRAYHTFDSRRCDPGFPDLVLARDGRVVYAELKTERGRFSADQATWADALGGVYLWRPSDLLAGRIQQFLQRD